jgi:hypothetical protein
MGEYQRCSNSAFSIASRGYGGRPQTPDRAGFTSSSGARCAHCGKPDTPGNIVPFGTGPHAWLHHRCWRPWSAARQAEAVAALEPILGDGLSYGVKPLVSSMNSTADDLGRKRSFGSTRFLLA